MAFLEPQIDLELDEGEELLYVTRRHWIVLLQRGIFVLIASSLLFGLAFYRAIGGTFIEYVGQVDPVVNPVNLLLVLIIAGLLLLWRRTSRGKFRVADLPYALGLGVLILLLVFRLQGGEVFYVDPINTYQAGDLINLILILLGVGTLSFLVYIFIDWANDFLILTSTRVIYDDQQFLVRHEQQQVMIGDIQQVNMSAESYFEYWFGYGTLLIRSFSPRRLIFANADRPQEMQRRILDEVNKLRRQREPEQLRQMIEDQVYGNKPPKQPGPAIHVEERKGPIPWLFEPNPHIDHEREIVIWRPFWIFLLLAMLRPLATFLLATIALSLLNRLGLLPAGWAFVLWLPIAIVCGGWAFWIREEHKHDMFILTRQDISDVDKKPFGPESRRRAPLGAIQEISYDVGFFENLLGFGDVIIETGGAGGGKFTFEHVPDPRDVQATINDYLTDFRKREKERQLQDSVALLRQYHLAQTAHGEVFNDERIAQAVTAYLASDGATRPLQYPSEVDLAAAPRGTRRQLRLAIRAELARLLRRRGQR